MQPLPSAFRSRALFSVLAARAVAVRAVAWLLLWEVSVLTLTPSAAFTATPTNAGNGWGGAAGEGGA